MVYSGDTQPCQQLVQVRSGGTPGDTDGRIEPTSMTALPSCHPLHMLAHLLTGGSRLPTYPPACRRVRAARCWYTRPPLSPAWSSRHARSATAPPQRRWRWRRWVEGLLLLRWGGTGALLGGLLGHCLFAAVRHRQLALPGTLPCLHSATALFGCPAGLQRMGAYRCILTHFSQRYPKWPEGLAQPGQAARGAADPTDPTAQQAAGPGAGPAAGATAAVAFDGMRVPLVLLPVLPTLMPAVQAALADAEEEEEQEQEEEQQEAAGQDGEEAAVVSAVA